MINQIKSIIEQWIDAELSYKKYNTIKMKCEHYGYSKHMRKEATYTIKQCEQELIKAINEYIDYPTNKFLCFNTQKKSKIKYDSLWQADIIKIPFIEKQEYYCVINLFENTFFDYFFNIKKGEYFFHKTMTPLEDG